MRLGWYGRDSSDPGEGPVKGSFEPLGFIRFLEILSS
jgi:hypothetical protein